MTVSAILLMGGRGERFNHSLPKQFHSIAGKKIYLHTLTRLIDSALFDEIILVTPEEWVERVKQDIPKKNIKVIEGGATRQRSSYLGLLSCNKDTEIVLIHDAVRPFVSTEILKANVEAAYLYGAVNTCISSTDTLVTHKERQFILSIPNRSDLLRGQTPQTFSLPLILQAHRQTEATNASDDCQLVLQMGKQIKIVEGDEKNQKITTPFDLQIATSLYTYLFN